MSKLKFIIGILFFIGFVSLNAQDDKYEDHYKKTADELTKNLKARIGLNDAQTSDIKDILIDYHRRVWGIKYNLIPAARDQKTDEERQNESDTEMNNNTRSSNKSDSLDNRNPADQKTARGYDNTQNNQTAEQKKDEFKGTTRDNDSVSYYAGLGRLEIENLRDADREANEDIESVLEGNQRNKYLDVKIDWWAVVKDKVYNTRYHSNLMVEPEGEYEGENQKK